MSEPLCRASQTEPPPFLLAHETLVLFDGVCRLCNGWARFLIAHDPQRRVRLSAVQSPEGQALLAWAGLAQDRFDTMAVIVRGQVLVRSDAFFAVMAQLPQPWRALGVLRIVPRPLRDWLYDRIALNRYRLFGRYDRCLLPSADHQQRFVSAASPTPHSDAPAP